MNNLNTAVRFRITIKQICWIGLVSIVWSQSASANSMWHGDYFPNVELVTHEGKTLRFYDDVIKDKVVAINFIFTGCKDACPLETARLRQVQQVLGDRVGRDVFFYSISIDPQDTPERLKEYAEKFHVGPGWQFLTGDQADITQIRKKLGLYREEIQQSDPTDHNVSMIVGNETSGRWMKRSPFDNPKVLARLLGDALHNFTIRTANQTSYAAATELPKSDRGEYLFRTRCSSCHTLDREDGVGPGLLGVTAVRERSWLSRWLMMPDQMIAEKDPIATELFLQYRKLAMPNLKLNQQDADALIDYMERIDRRMAEAEATEKKSDPPGSAR